jgi:ribosome-binding protein aMBF1 (putative translation factor)
MSKKKCPVCDWEIQDQGIQVQLTNQQITVCCEECAEKAKQDPSQYIKPKE